MNRPRHGAALLLAAGLLLSPPIAGQQPPHPPTIQTDSPTFRTGTEIVTVDAVVVDRDGRHVTDVRPEEFVVTLGGKRQQLRQAVYVPTRGAADAAAALSARAISGVASARTVPRLGPLPLTTRREDTGRVMAVVVDDLGLSFESTAYVRLALTKLVDEQLQPGDLAAVLRTGAGVGTLQQFTTDKRLLHAAIDRVRWTVVARTGISAFAPVSGLNALDDPVDSGSGTAEADNEDTIDGLRTSISAAASLSALEYVVHGVESLPGRKSVVFVSEGFRLFARPTGFKSSGGSRVWRAFTRVMDRAQRQSRTRIEPVGGVRGQRVRRLMVPGYTRWPGCPGKTCPGLV